MSGGVSLSIANTQPACLCLSVYLPKDWVDDDERRSKAGVPSDISFKTKPEIALEQIRWRARPACRAGVALMDGAMAVTRGCAPA